MFLKSPERVEAMAMLMGLCFLIYTLGQRQMRQALEQAHSGLKNQLGKLTQRPTLRWIFQCFQAVHLLIVNGVKQISNLTDERLGYFSFSRIPVATTICFCERLRENLNKFSTKILDF